MSDNSVVKVGDVEGPVGTKLHVNRAKPRIVGSDEVLFFYGFFSGAGFQKSVAVDAARHYVADKNVVAKLGGPLIAAVVNYAVQSRGTVIVFHDFGAESQPVVGFAEAGIVGVADQQVGGHTMAVGSIQVAERILRHAKGVDLAEGEMLRARAVQMHAVSVAGMHGNFAAVAASYGCIIIESVSDVEPAVKASRKGRMHAVGVAFISQRAVKFGSLIRPAVAVGVFEMPDVGNAPSDDAILVRVEADGDVEAVGKSRHRVVTAVAVRIFNDFYRVSSRTIRRRGEGIFVGVRHPKAAAGVKSQVHGLGNFRFGGHKFDGKTRRKMKGFLLLFGRKRIGGANAGGKGVLRRKPRPSSRQRRKERR